MKPEERFIIMNKNRSKIPFYAGRCEEKNRILIINKKQEEDSKTKRKTCNYGRTGARRKAHKTIRWLGHPAKRKERVDGVLEEQKLEWKITEKNSECCHLTQKDIIVEDNE